MFVQLSATPLKDAKPSDAIDLLIECHARIRLHLEMAERLTNAAHAPEQEVVDAASALLRYFETAFPLHVVDEDLSLLPRLTRLTLPADVAVAIQILQWEHEELDPLVEGLCLIWRDVQRSPSKLSEVQPNLRDILDLLRPKLLTHLELEEALVFPYARTVLNRDALAELGAQMRHRRQG